MAVQKSRMTRRHSSVPAVRTSLRPGSSRVEKGQTRTDEEGLTLVLALQVSLTPRRASPSA